MMISDGMDRFGDRAFVGGGGAPSVINTIVFSYANFPTDYTFSGSGEYLVWNSEKIDVKGELSGTNWVPIEGDGKYFVSAQLSGVNLTAVPGAVNISIELTRPPASPVTIAQHWTHISQSGGFATAVSLMYNFLLGDTVKVFVIPDASATFNANPGGGLNDNATFLSIFQVR